MPPEAKLFATKKVTLIIPSLSAGGGAERVMSLLANDFVNKVEQVNLISLTKSQYFYQLDPRIKVYEPGFRLKKPHYYFFKRDASTFVTQTDDVNQNFLKTSGARLPGYDEHREEMDFAPPKLEPNGPTTIY